MRGPHGISGGCGPPSLPPTTPRGPAQTALLPEKLSVASAGHGGSDWMCVGGNPESFSGSASHRPLAPRLAGSMVGGGGREVTVGWSSLAAALSVSTKSILLPQNGPEGPNEVTAGAGTRAGREEGGGGDCAELRAPCPLQGGTCRPAPATLARWSRLELGDPRIFPEKLESQIYAKSPSNSLTTADSI